MENLNTQTNLNNQLKSQYANLLRINNNIEKTNEDLREKNNSLCIQKDLIESDMFNLRKAFDYEKTSNASLTGRLNELEARFDSLSSESVKLKDREVFSQNEISKLNSALKRLEKEKSNLEYQLKNIEQNISQNDVFLSNHIEVDVMQQGSHNSGQRHSSNQVTKKSHLRWCV